MPLRFWAAVSRTAVSAPAVSTVASGTTTADDPGVVSPSADVGATSVLGIGSSVHEVRAGSKRKEATMDEIKGIARVKFHPGKVEEWKRLSKEAMAIVRTRDRLERYRDTDAAIEHFSNISHLMEPIMATASITGEVLGTPNSAK